MCAVRPAFLCKAYTRSTLRPHSFKHACGDKARIGLIDSRCKSAVGNKFLVEVLEKTKGVWHYHNRSCHSRKIHRQQYRILYSFSAYFLLHSLLDVNFSLFQHVPYYIRPDEKWNMWTKGMRGCIISLGLFSETPMQEMQKLMAHLAKVWECNKQRYPELAGMTPDQRRNFLVKHSVLHIAKTNGRIAAICEDFDHNGLIDDDEVTALQIATVKMFVNALKLAEEVGLSASDLLARAPTFVK